LRWRRGGRGGGTVKGEGIVRPERGGGWRREKGRIWERRNVGSWACPDRAAARRGVKVVYGEGDAAGVGEKTRGRVDRWGFETEIGWRLIALVF